MAIRYGRTRHIDTVDGTEGSDFLYGWEEGDDIRADFMSDTLNGGGGDDYLFGGGGWDHLHGGDDNDTLFGGWGGDELDGGEGTDTAVYLTSLQPVYVNLLAGFGSSGEAESDTYTSIEDVVGSDHDDVIIGNDVGNVLEGRRGGDRLYGEGGDDHLYGDEGIDRVYGGEGFDHLYGGGDTDYLRGEGGPDDLNGGDGDDFLYGGSGDDLFIGSPGADLNNGDGGGGLGRDIVDYSASPLGVTVNLATGTGSGGFAAGDRYVGIENVFGSAFRDWITGDGGNNVLLGGGGDDVISGGDGNDLLIGGAGADVLDGGIHLDPGGDRVSYEGSSTGVWVDLAGGWGRSGDAEGDKLWGIEDITGSREKDVLFGDNNDNTLEGGAGDDELHGGLGGLGGDILMGGSHDDRLWGDAGPDHLWGGSGADRFMYASVNDSVPTLPRLIAEYDTIYDFVSGVDKIDLSAIDANTTSAAAGDQRFILTLRPEFGAAGLLRIDNLGDGTATVYGETTGDGVADLQIVVFGHVNAGDIIM